MKSNKPASSKLLLIQVLTLLSAPLMAYNAFAEEAHHDAQHAFHKNTVGVFAGITGDRREHGFTLAFEYERRLNEKFGIGVVVERAFGDLDINVYIAGAVYHSGPWKYFLGAGIETSDHHHGNESLARIGLERAFEVGSFEISPQLAIDFVDDDAVIIFGVVFAKGF